MRWFFGLWLLVYAAAPGWAQLSADQKQLNIDSFEKVWTTIRDKHWEKKPGGLDWQAIHDEYRPQVVKAESTDAARAVMQAMLGRLKETHFAIIPAAVYSETGDTDSDSSKLAGEGSPGIDLRVVDNHAVVTRVDAGSPAQKAGIKTGWIVVSVDGKPLDAAIQKLKGDPDLHELVLVRAVLSRLSGPVGGKVSAVFRDGSNQDHAVDLDLAAPRGEPSKFGNLPVQHVWVDTKKIGNTGYVGFNMFLDLGRVMSRFGDEVASCMKCDGLIIDLRGNPGGIGGMAMGMAGWLIDKQGLSLGNMYTRDSTIHFAVNPRPEVYKGPVAVIVDGMSASTSEIFAGGLKDLGRAKVFGERTAAAALPSLIEKLPNGDGFQYAVANYISEGGKPLEGLGVAPDTTIHVTREALLAGHDQALEAALDWIQKQKGKP